MFKTSHFYITFLFFLLTPFAWSQSVKLATGNYELSLPEGFTTFKLDEQQVVIKFNNRVSKKSIADFFIASSFFGKYDSTWKMPFPDVYVARFALQAKETDWLTKLSRLQKNKLVSYTAPVLIYNKTIQQAVYDRFFAKVNTRQGLDQLRKYAASLHFIIEEQHEKDLWYCRVNKQSKGNAFEIARYLQQQNQFEFAEPDFIYWGKQHTNDALYTQQWALNNTAQFTGGIAGADIEAVNAWGLTTGLPAIKVAILDCFGSTAQFTHADFAFQTLYDATGTGFIASGYQGEAHGINCGGLIGATANNSLGIAGIAYNAKVIAVKIGTIINTSGNWSATGNSVSNGITWAYQNAHVLSNSNGLGSSSSLINTAISNCITIGRWGKGAPFFSSNGNSGTTTIAYPASNTQTIAVAASDVNDQKASFSDYGVGTDIAAPGVNVYSTDIAGTAGFSSTDYFLFSGTSAACPVAAGIMALILSADSNLSYTAARNIIETTCEKVGPYTYTGSVSGQPNGAWTSTLGYGRVNAYQAVLQAMATPYNNNPDSAYALSVGSSCSFTSGITAGANETMPADFCSGSAATIAKDVWYKFTPTQGNVTIRVQSGYNTDIVLGLYGGPSTSPYAIQCADITGAGGLEVINAGLNANTTYFIRIYDYNGNANGTDFKICLQSTPAIASNTVGSTQTICPGVLPAMLTGSLPGGGAGVVLGGYRDGSDFPGANLPASWSAPLNQDTIIRGISNLNSYGRTGGGTGVVLAHNYVTALGKRGQILTGNFNPTTVYDSLRFDVAHATYPAAVDSLIIFVSNGGNFTRLAGWGSAQTVNTSTGITTAAAQTAFFSPASSQWTTKVLAMPAGTTQVRFELYSGFGNELYLDRVLVDNAAPSYTYLWLKSTTSASAGYAPADGNNATQNYFIPAGLNTSTWYRRLVISGGVRDTSAAVAVTVKPKPATAYSVNNPTQCFNGHSFSFTDNSTFSGGTFTRLWNLGSSATDTTSMAAPSRTYAAPGQYSVKLVLKGSNGCNDSLSKTVSTGNKPDVGFTINDNLQPRCKDFNFVFTDTSKITAGAMNRTWNLGSGPADTSNLATANKVFAGAGTYTIKLWVSSFGCKDSAAKTVTVAPRPVAGFGVAYATQCLNQNQFAFADSSTGAVQNRSWNFGSSATDTSNMLNPGKVYTQAGTYAVSLAVVSVNGCTDTIVKNVSVVANPVAGFSTNNAAQCMNTNNFTFTDTTAGNHARKWSLGSGVSDTASAAGVQKTYVTHGVYTIQLVAMADNGCRDTVQKTVTVFAKPTVAFAINQALQCANNNSFVFSDTSTIAMGSTNASWNFGDAATSQLHTVQKSYLLAGTYHVMLKVVSNQGCADSIQKSVTVFTNPKAGFTINMATQCARGNGFVFTDTSSGSIHNWNFSDGDSSGMQTALKTFSTAGNFGIRLVTINSNSCSDTISRTVSVYAQPGATISTGGSAQFCRGGSVILRANTGPGYSYQWVDHNGVATGSTDSALTANATNGFRVIVHSAQGCADTSALQSVFVIQPPAAALINPVKTAFCEGDSIELIGSTSPGATLQWYRNDTALSAAMQANLSVKQTGSYKIKATNTCDSVSAAVVITFHPNPPKPVISRSLDTLYSSAVTGNQWYFHGNALNGANAATYLAAAKGNYMVRTNNIFNCSATSDLFSFVPSGIATSGLPSAELEVYPNPNSGTFSIRCNTPVTQLEVTDMSGRSLFASSVPFNETSISLRPDLPSAVYFVKATWGGKLTVKRVVVVK